MRNISDNPYTATFPQALLTGVNTYSIHSIFRMINHLKRHTVVPFHGFKSDRTHVFESSFLLVRFHIHSLTTSWDNSLGSMFTPKICANLCKKHKATDNFKE